MHQEQHHPGRSLGMQLGPVDFAKYAESGGEVQDAIEDGVASENQRSFTFGSILSSSSPGTTSRL